ncbi:hypothetical protein QBC36DRAFT_306484 [Triangularia setosa]|uniref:Uncharacterized protein n=1 Tax=Triangularia setosa TaxID=2587417 RepID=A0AAN7ABN5_9PEZI|nr:hypothetical protein QBC36DRAFT_306484 [Podospora setosa]
MTFNFLALPQEIWLEIYTQLLLLHPIRYMADMAPGKPAPRPPHGYIPKALLQANRQVHEEGRLVPFHENEFVFVRYYKSGGGPALEFADAMLKLLFSRTIPGCRDGALFQLLPMRYVRMDVFQDHIITGDGRVKPDLTEYVQMEYRQMGHREMGWERLCSLLPAVRGLCLNMVAHPSLYSRPMGYSLDPDPESDAEETIVLARYERDLEEWRWKWVDCGLRKMEGLGDLGVEVKNTRKFRKNGVTEWVKRLDKRLNQGRGDAQRVRVVCVKRVDESQEKEDESDRMRYLQAV